MERRLKPEEVELIRDVLYDETKTGRTRLFHRTGETDSRPLFSTWVQLANLFRDAESVVINVRPETVTERGYEK